MITSSNYWSISRMTKSMGMCMEHSGVVGYSRGSGDQANKGLNKHMKMYISLGVCIIIFFLCYIISIETVQVFWWFTFMLSLTDVVIE